MRVIVKALVVSIALAVLGSSAAVSVAQAPRRPMVRGECRCTCWYKGAQNKWELGTLAFPPPANNVCDYVGFENYVPCKDSAGQQRPGEGYAGCKLVGGVTGPRPPALKQQ